MKIMVKGPIKIFLGILVGCVLMYLILCHINLRNFIELIKNVDWFALIPVIFMYSSTYILRSIRYYFIVLPLRKTYLLDNFPYTMVGFFVNNILPLRLGELIRAKMVGEKFSIPRSSVLATIIVERIFDVVVLVVLFFITVSCSCMSFPEFIRISLCVLTIFLASCFVVFYILIMHERKILNALSKIPMPGVIKSVMIKLVYKFTSGLIVLKDSVVLIKIFIMSTIIWTVEALCLVGVAYACGVRLSILGAIFTVVAIGMGSIIPTAPGYFGSFELMSVLALSTIGVNKNIAFTCTVVYHFLQLTVITILGVACAIKIKLSPSDLFRFSKIR